MITCAKCFKENQDHYKFCLGCGAELPRDATPKKFASGTPPQGVPIAKPAMPHAIEDETTTLGTGTSGVPGAPLGGAARPRSAPPPPPGGGAAPAPAVPIAAPLPAAALGGAPAAGASGPPIMCPQCEHPNPANNKFCASCGFKLARPVLSDVPPAATPAASSSGVVLTALRADGTEAGTYALPSGTVTIGRDTGAIFAGDSYLSPRHATFTPRGGKLYVHDEQSLNGVYKKLRRDEPIIIGMSEIFRIGQEIIRFEPLTPLAPTGDGVERLGSPAKGYIGRIALVIGRDATGNAYPVPETGLHLGRERGDVLFPEDGYVSGLHCRLSWQNSQLLLTDLGSSNGTFVRLTGEVDIVHGDILLMGQQLFRIAMP
ncbi:MAG TPA: FHA domain-containing protein [Byssovorax sp.]